MTIARVLKGHPRSGTDGGDLQGKGVKPVAHEWLEKEDLSVYVISDVPRSFHKELKSILHEQGEDVEVMRLDDDLSNWVLARVRGAKRQSSDRSPASEALWRAFRALSAARYHLRGDPKMDERIRKLRDRVEALWYKTSPMHDNGDAS